MISFLFQPKSKYFQLNTFCLQVSFSVSPKGALLYTSSQAVRAAPS